MLSQILYKFDMVILFSGLFKNFIISVQCKSKLALGRVRNVWTANYRKHTWNWLKGPRNLILVPFQPSEKLFHIEDGCSGDSNFGKMSMTSARHNSKRTELKLKT